jgi:long-chain acyl-CoA synthetase
LSKGGFIHGFTIVGRKEGNMTERPWLRHYDANIPHTMDHPEITLDRFLSDSARKHPDHTALIFGARVGTMLLDARLRYGTLDRTVDRFAGALQKMGVRKGDRVALMLPNCPQFVIGAYATWRIGGIVVCCNPLYVASEVRHLLNDSGAETMVVMSSLYDRVKGIRPETALKRVIVTNIKTYFPSLLKLLFTLGREKKEGHRVVVSGDHETHRFEDLLRQAPQRPGPVAMDPGEVSTLIYTGGTTGGPKGAQLTHRNLVSNAAMLNTWAGGQEAKDVLISVMPFFHSYGLTVGMNTPIANALTAVLIPNPRDLQHILRSVEKHKATVLPAIPTIFAGFNNLPGIDKYDLTSVRVAPCGAAPLPPEVQKRFESITGCRMVEAYGLTETSPTATMSPLGRPKANSIGIPVQDTDVKIVDVETGTREMTTGELGEIIIRGPQVMKGYWNLSEATNSAIRKGPDGQEGWFFSGDIGYMDEEGYFHIADRKKDMIIASGYNVYPADVEAVLFNHPKVKEAAVIGVPHEKRGETVKAFVVLKEGMSATAEEIILFCRDHLAPYKIPRIVAFREDLPKSLIGKVLRRKLREEAVLEKVTSL